MALGSQEFGHDPQRRPPRAAVVEAVAQARAVALPGRAGEMRRPHDVVGLEQGIVGRRRFFVEHVEAGAEQLA